MFIIHESANEIAPVVSNNGLNVLEFVAVLQDANNKNRNGRYYSHDLIEEAIHTPYVQERLADRSLLIECGHPMDKSPVRQMTIDPNNCVAMIKELYWEGDKLMGVCETLNTSKGRDFKGLIEQGSKVAFSLRAQGKFHYDRMLDASVVEKPMMICTWDYVINPSHACAKIVSDQPQSYNVRESYSSELMCALCESAEVFTDGDVINIEDLQEEEKFLDFTKYMGCKYIPINEEYKYDENDKVKNIEEDSRFMILENGKTTKRVITEDYYLKELRHKISKL